jgi:RNA polymerase sigma factor (sigma-70 family)
MFPDRFDPQKPQREVQPPTTDVLALDEAVTRLEEQDPRKAQIVDLRYYAGLTTEETAEALGISVSTVEREWRYIRSWLRTYLEDRQADEEPGSK